MGGSPKLTLISWGAAIAQWMHLHLPSCHTGFKSQTHHLHLYQFIFELCRVEKTKINKKEAGIGPFFKKPWFRIRRQDRDCLAWSWAWSSRCWWAGRCRSWRTRRRTSPASTSRQTSRRCWGRVREAPRPRWWARPVLNDAISLFIRESF